MIDPDRLLSHYNPATGELAGSKPTERRLADLRGCFADTAAYEAALTAGNPLLYRVASVEPAAGEGHLHAWRPAAEFYFGLSGEGMMLLEDETTGESRLLPLRPHHAVYVPGRTAHRTMNTGTVPLTYLGVYPARAGHDYSAIAQRNFRMVIVERAGRPTMIERHPG